MFFQLVPFLPGFMVLLGGGNGFLAGAPDVVDALMGGGTVFSCGAASGVFADFGALSAEGGDCFEAASRFFAKLNISLSAIIFLMFSEVPSNST